MDQMSQRSQQKREIDMLIIILSAEVFASYGSSLVVNSLRGAMSSNVRYPLVLSSKSRMPMLQTISILGF